MENVFSNEQFSPSEEYSIFCGKSNLGREEDLEIKNEEYCEDDEDLSDCLVMIVSERKESRPRKSVCHRCRTVSKVNAKFPYCLECNWDSLNDSCWSHE